MLERLQYLIKFIGSCTSRTLEVLWLPFNLTQFRYSGPATIPMATWSVESCGLALELAGNVRA